ncbi:hypothetical protein IAE35_05645 [Pseudomonas sp. S75]|uniref:hypothetical protein n=1 Tax=unclassified Pseudomonas TaxID=196821 RepID=UPI001906DF8D|nr:MULTISPECIES: hypothetical protein [unclassified Pseudomonas]MBJ9975210.1 hypothetical protein [Pseudomonas sp. S30]MBK0152816.1 hypothetical protein [Pseudomonas sp. S75]
MIAPVRIASLARQDVLDSLLLAQLYANQRHDPFIDAEEWARACVTSLQKIRWSLTSSASSTQTLTSTFTLESRFTAAASGRPSAWMDALDALSAGARKALLPWCTRVHDRQVIVKLAVVRICSEDHFEIRSLLAHCPSPLPAQWLEHVQMASTRSPVPTRSSDVSFNLSSDYAEMRNKVIQALGTHRSSEIVRL